MAKSDEMERDTSADLPISATLRKFAELVTMVPLRGEEGDDALLARILGAESAEELDSAWRGETAKVLNRTIVVTDISRMPSDIADNALGFFLVCEGHDASTGEEIVWTTGSKYVVAELVKAYCSEWLPLTCVLRQADKPTKAGFFPQHLEIVTPETPL